MWLSWYGKEFVQFAQAARVELRKVVWPARQETMQTTVVVFVFAGLMGVFFFLLDLALTWMTRFLGGTTG
jgi:preprotein translocase subunit SecE